MDINIKIEKYTRNIDMCIFFQIGVDAMLLSK